MDTLYKPNILERAIESFELPGPTIPRTGGDPAQLMLNCSSLPLINDIAARNVTPKVVQVSYILYPRDTLGNRLMSLLISLMAKAMVCADLKPVL